MTSGRAIAHSEESPREHARLLHGAQLWVALPDADRHRAPLWEHHTDLPRVHGGGLDATVILGELDCARSPGTAFTPIVGADVSLTAGASARLPLTARAGALVGYARASGANGPRETVRV